MHGSIDYTQTKFLYAIFAAEPTSVHIYTYIFAFGYSLECLQ